MLEQINNPLPCVATFTASGAPATGLTVTVNVRRWNGSTWAPLVTGASATEVGDGAYSYQLATGSNTAEGLYLFSFSTAGVADVKVQNVGWAVQKAGIEHLDADISSRSPAGATITTSLPVSSDGSLITVVQGDDYKNADGLAVRINLVNAPDPTSGAVHLYFRHTTLHTVDLKVTGTVVSATVVRFDLTSAQTAALKVGALAYEYEAKAMLADGSVITLAGGDVTVLPWV